MATSAPPWRGRGRGRSGGDRSRPPGGPGEAAPLAALPRLAPEIDGLFHARHQVGERRRRREHHVHGRLREPPDVSGRGPPAGSGREVPQGKLGGACRACGSLRRGLTVRAPVTITPWPTTAST